jgi:hypothetical protein
VVHSLSVVMVEVWLVGTVSVHVLLREMHLVL